MLARQILAKTRNSPNLPNSPNTIARQNLLIYSMIAMHVLKMNNGKSYHNDRQGWQSEYINPYAWPIHTHTNPARKIKWPFAITRLTVHIYSSVDQNFQSVLWSVNLPSKWLFPGGYFNNHDSCDAAWLNKPMSAFPQVNPHKHCTCIQHLQLL